MKKCTILLIVLLVSIIVNIYQYQTCSLSITEPGPGECASTTPFSTAFEISNTDARGFNEQFVASLISPDSTTGGIISRAAFEEMLCLDKCNGIAYAFAATNPAQPARERMVYSLSLKV